MRENAVSLSISRMEFYQSQLNNRGHIYQSLIIYDTKLDDDEWYAICQYGVE